MFPGKPEDVDAEQLLRVRHCILVAASNPYGFADQTRTGISGSSTIAESIAKLFTEVCDIKMPQPFLALMWTVLLVRAHQSW